MLCYIIRAITSAGTLVMDTGEFEDLIMNVYKHSTPPDSSDISYMKYLRRQEGTLMSLGKRSNQTIDFSDESTSTKSLWAIGSVYASAQSVINNNDYEASILIQSKLTNGTPRNIIKVIGQLLQFNARLCTTKYGNFVVQAEINNASPTSYHQIYISLVGSFASIAEDPFGCWVLFLLIDKASHEQQQYIKAEMKANIIGKMNINATRVWRALELRAKV